MTSIAGDKKMLAQFAAHAVARESSQPQFDVKNAEFILKARHKISHILPTENQKLALGSSS